MTLRIEFTGFDNPETKMMVFSAFEASSHLLPSWVYEVYFNAEDSADDTPCCSMSTNFGYRQIQITVYSSFYSLAESDRMSTMRHEVLHALTGDLVFWVKGRLIEMVQDENLKQELDFILSEKLEGVNQDLCRLVGELEDRGE